MEHTTMETVDRVRRKLMPELRCLALIPFLLVCFQNNANAAKGADCPGAKTDFDKAAVKILKEMGYLKQCLSGAASTKPKIRIAINPFDKTKLPVQEARARSWNERLQSSFLEFKSGNVEMVALDAMDDVIKNALSLSGEDPEVVIPRILEAAHANIMITGTAFREKDDIALKYRAILGENMQVLAAAERINIPNVYQGKTTGKVLDVAFEEAAKWFVAKLDRKDIKRLVIGDVFESGTKTPSKFGDYVRDQLRGHLLRVFEEQNEGQRLRAIPLSSLGYSKSFLLTEDDRLPPSAKPGDYLLKGQYWPDDKNVVRLSVDLESINNQPLSWTDDIYKETIPKKLTFVERRNRLDKYTESDLLAFNVTTRDGKAPSYRIGERIQLILYASKDSYVDCYLRNAHGQVQKILPNEYFKRSYIEGKREAVFPPPRTNLKYIAEGPTGHDDIRCFAMDRNVSHKLPMELQRNNIATRRAAKLWEDLSTVYNRLPGVQVAESAIRVTIRDQARGAQ